MNKYKEKLSLIQQLHGSYFGDFLRTWYLSWDIKKYTDGSLYTLQSGSHKNVYQKSVTRDPNPIYIGYTHDHISHKYCIGTYKNTGIHNTFK